MKEWIYIVTWCILVQIPIQNKPIMDKFGRQSGEYHPVYLTVTSMQCGHQRAFNDRDSAFVFYKEALLLQHPVDTGNISLAIIDEYDIYSNPLMTNKNLYNVKIDSLYLEEQK